MDGRAPKHMTVWSVRDEAIRAAAVEACIAVVATEANHLEVTGAPLDYRQGLHRALFLLRSTGASGVTGSLEIRGYLFPKGHDDPSFLIADGKFPPHFLHGPFSDGVNVTIVRGGRLVDEDNLEYPRDPRMPDPKVLGKMFDDGVPLGYDSLTDLPDGAWLHWDNAKEIR